MNRLLVGLAAAALFAAPAMAQTATSRAQVVALCIAAPADCAAIFAAYLDSLPLAARLAAYEAIVADLEASGVAVTLPPEPQPASITAPGSTFTNIVDDEEDQEEPDEASPT
jgi:hypothetical protein